MPKNENVLRKAHSVLSASVLPTKQATVIPTKWKRISVFSNTAQSSTYDFYAVTLLGTAYNYTTSEYRDVEVQRVYRATHPSCVIGSAVMAFFRENARATIQHIEILKGII